jgi:UDPglucose 6-dehydrogenase
MTAAKIAVIGLWHQGMVGAACLADLGYRVTAADPVAEVVEAVRAGQLPVFEPGLDALVAKGVAMGNLQFTRDLQGAVKGAEFVFVMFDTPVDENDKSDLTSVFNAVRSIAGHLVADAIVYVTAQVPVGTCAELLEILRGSGANHVAIAYSPENLRLGQAIERYRHPALPVIGTDDDRCFERLAALLSPLCGSWHRSNLVTAEMLKHALNTFLAVSICFANELGNLCDAAGADGAKIAELLRLEPRVGPKAMLMPGLGFAGGTLARDLVSLRNLGDGAGIETRFFDGAWASNQDQNKTIVRRLQVLLPSLAGASICVFGLTYKPDTSTLRRSSALEVINDIVAAGGKVTAHDPMADPQEIAGHHEFRFLTDPYAAAVGADALVLMTPWSEYRNLDFARLRAVMRGNLIFDTARLWDADTVFGRGFAYHDIGRGRNAKKLHSRA